MTAPAPSWQQVTVSGTYRKIDGTPHAGSIVFTFPTRVVSLTDGLIFPAGSSITVTLDGTGHFSKALPAVDDPDNLPADWSIKVEEKLTGPGAGGLTYFIKPTMAMVAAGLDLKTIPVPVTTQPQPSQVRGVPGGVAALDADGDVVDADGNKVSGGTGGGVNLPIAQSDVTGLPTALTNLTNAVAAKADASALAAKADASALATKADASALAAKVDDSELTAAVDTLNSAIAAKADASALAAKADASALAAKADTTALATKVDKVLFSAKGDLLVGTGSGALDKIPAGTNGQVLTADSLNPLGVKWSNPAAGGSGGAAAGFPSWAPANLTRRFYPERSTYGCNAATLARAHTGAGRARSGQGYFHILAVGDSHTSGYMGANASPVDDFPNAWLQVAARVLIAAGIPSGGTGFVPAYSYQATVDPRWTFTGTWSNANTAYASATSTPATATLTLAGGGGTRVDLVSSNAGAPFTYQVFNSANTVINSGTLSIDGTSTPKVLSITGLTDAHHVTITAVAGTNVIFSGCIFKGSGLLVSNFALYGSYASGTYGWESNAFWYGFRQGAYASVPDPDLLTGTLGGNDKVAGIADSTIGTALTNIYAQWPNASKLLMGSWEAGGFSSGSIWKTYVGSLYSLADTLGVGLIDFVDRTGGYTAMNNRGLFQDGGAATHPNRAAHADIGQLLGQLLLT